MPTTGNMTKNIDKTENYRITASTGNDENAASMNAFVNDQRTKHDLLSPNAPPYSSAGVQVGLENISAGSVGLKGVHLPNRGDEFTASANVNLINIDNHKLAANAFTTTVMPKAGPNFGTHGGGVEYSYKEKIGANASVTHTPMFKQTQYSVGGQMNFHQTPTTSLGLNVGASKIDSPFGRGNWQPSGSLFFKKSF